MNTRLIITTALASLFISQAHAADGPIGGDSSHKKWSELSDTEKKAEVEKNMEKRHERRAEMKEKWQKMTPEEKEKAKADWKEKREARHAAMKEKLDKMPPEKREQVQKNMQERKAIREELRKEHGDDKTHAVQK